MTIERESVGSESTAVPKRTRKAQAEVSLQKADPRTLHILTRLIDDAAVPIDESVLGCQRMLESSLGKLTHDQRGTLESFMNNVASASRRMRDYVDLLRFEVRELALRPLAFDLEEVVSQVASQFYQAARSKGLELVAEASAQPLPAVNADPSRVARVLSDLISNAIKFTERGQVTISTELYDRSVAVHVVDTGVGISAAQLPRLFEDFFQDGPDLETGNRGRGLGLTLSRRLIMRMGGDLWATSTVGAGSKFSFTVPRAPESEGQPFVGTA